MRKLAAAALSAMAIASVGLSAPAEAASRPGVVVDYGSARTIVKVKPSSFWPFSDVYYTKLHWSKVTSTKGWATGVRHINTCSPTCADGNYRTDRVRLKFTRVRTTATNRRVFTKVTVTVTRTGSVSSHRLPLNAEGA